MFLPQRGRMSAQLTGEGECRRLPLFPLLVVIRHSPSSPASRELPPLGEARWDALASPDGGGGSGLPAARNRKGCHPEEAKSEPTDLAAGTRFVSPGAAIHPTRRRRDPSRTLRMTKGDRLRWMTLQPCCAYALIAASNLSGSNLPENHLSFCDKILYSFINNLLWFI